MGDDWTWSDVAHEGGVTPRTDEVPLVLDGNIAARLDKARAELTAAKRDNDSLDASAVEEAQAVLDEIEEQAQASIRVFTVRSIGHRRWKELMGEHPSDNPGERWNPIGFIPAVLLEACDQFRTPADVDNAISILSSGQVLKLFGAARVINEGEDRVPLLRGR